MTQKNTATGINIATDWDLTQPIPAKLLKGLTLEELQHIEQAFCKRAVECLATHENYTKPNPTYSYALSNRSANDSSGKQVFSYSTEQHLQKHNRFVPGSWWQVELDRMDKERKLYDTNLADFPQRESDRIISRLSGNN